MNSTPDLSSDDPARLRRIISNQQQKINLLEEFIRLQNSKTFAPSTEKNPGQGELLNEEDDALEAELEAQTSVDTSTQSSNTPSKKKPANSSISSPPRSKSWFMRVRNTPVRPAKQALQQQSCRRNCCPKAWQALGY